MRITGVLLGEGTFATVFPAWDLQRSEDVAIKVPVLQTDQYAEKALKKEIDFLKLLRTSNLDSLNCIVGCLGEFDWQGELLGMDTVLKG